VRQFKSNPRNHQEPTTADSPRGDGFALVGVVEDGGKCAGQDYIRIAAPAAVMEVNSLDERPGIVMLINIFRSKH